jgi:hypothetical protein
VADKQRAIAFALVAQPILCLFQHILAVFFLLCLFLGSGLYLPVFSDRFSSRTTSRISFSSGMLFSRLPAGSLFSGRVPKVRFCTSGFDKPPASLANLL